MRPPCAFMMALHSVSPSPSPRRPSAQERGCGSSLRSKSWGSSSGGKPAPSSSTAIITVSPCPAISTRMRVAPSAWFTAFSKRFRMTCSIKVASIGTSSSSSGAVVTGRAWRLRRSFITALSTISSTTSSVRCRLTCSPAIRVTESIFSVMRVSHRVS